MKGVPVSLINFVTRTVIGHIWGTFMSVAEDIAQDKRPCHKEAIDAKQEFYSWVERRVSVMLSNLNNDNRISESNESRISEGEYQRFIDYLQS